MSTFVETQKTAISRLTTLELEITSHKQHIARLKEELSDACSRQMAEGEVIIVNGLSGISGNILALRGWWVGVGVFYFLKQFLSPGLNKIKPGTL